MTQSTFYLTQKGLEEIKAEYKNLKDKKRPQEIERVRKARGMGNLDDNPEYTAASESLALVEKRIEEVEHVLKNYSLIEENHGEEFVMIGSTVVVESEGQADEFTIVGSLEAAPAEGKISNESPVGQALLGTKVGEVVEVNTPIVRAKYKVLEVK